MSSQNAPALERIDPTTNTIAFSTPVKKINNADDLTFFLSSTTYRDLMTWLLQLNRAMFPTKDTDGNIQECTLDSPREFPQSVQNIQALLSHLSGFIDQAPPDTGPRRFGNVAFKAWFRLVEEGVGGLLETYLGEILGRFGEQREGLIEELKEYVLGSFGSKQRLDYGTGHELSFLAFLGGLWKVRYFQVGEERAIVVGIIQPYLTLVRRLVESYTLEPAGSHGVWGLDDHSFIPYIFGSAQYGPPISPSSPTPTEGSLPTAPAPSEVTNKALVASLKDSNMYLSAIAFIYAVKRGPFWEHSPVLYDISGIKDGWGKINKGMLKMYAAEVLGKFPVVQHFAFGGLFRWKVDPEAARGAVGSVHALNQPRQKRSMDVPPAPPAGGAVGTKAPWAMAGSAMPAAGVPSTRRPWTQSSTPGRQAPPSGAAGMAPTAAPWAKRDGNAR